MTILTIFLSIFMLLIIVFSIPVRIRVESRLVCYIYWLFVKVRIRSVKGSVKTDLKLFNRKTSLFSPKKISKEASSPTAKKDKKEKRKKLTKEMVLEILRDQIVMKILRISIRFMTRCFRSVRISFLDWDIGLRDYYWQGILSGLLHAIPGSKEFRIAGNFQEMNQFQAEIRIGILRLIFALMLFLLSFPYFNAIRLYRKVYLRKGRAISPFFIIHGRPRKYTESF